MSLGERNGQVVTFFSYKGGTGRTMALANVAWILASHGKRVLVVDWDLDSPGLHRFFNPFLNSELFNATSGIMEILSEYARTATHLTERAPDWHVPYARVLPHALSLEWTFPAGGTLDIISAGRPGQHYAGTVAGFQWDNFYSRLGGGLFLEAMRDDMRRQYDYTLIDSRTGLSDIAGICTVRFPDTVVNCFTLSGQSIDGAATVARSIDELSDREIRILPVPMRVEDGEQVKLENGRAVARARFSGYPSGMTTDAARRYWGEVGIPYKPFYAYEETLATFGDEPRLTNSLLSAFERLTAVVTHGQIGEFPALPEDVRQRFAAAFERHRPLSPPDVFLSYAPEDRSWADWISHVLSRTGAHVVPQGTGFPAGADVHEEVTKAVAQAGCTVVLLSPSYLRSSQARMVWETLAAVESDRARRPLIPIRVADVRLNAPFDAWNSVDLVRVDEETAMDAVIRSIGQVPEGMADDGDGIGPRFPGSRPPVWSVPARNASFTGRTVMLEKKLRDQLSAGVAVVTPQALFGLGGIGKTQLVLEYAHRFMSDYDLVWWIPAEQEELIDAALAEIAPHVGIRRDDITMSAEAVLEALRRGQPYSRWLLVFDNADDPDGLASHLPKGSGRIVITSRDPAWSHLATPLEVDAFLREESVEHLVRRVPGLSAQAADDVADILGDLPLAVELASAWLETTGMPVHEYLDLLETQLAAWLAEAGNRPTDYPSTAAAAWQVSIERLRRESPAAARLLEICSCFAPEPISMRLLYGDEAIRCLLPHDPTLTEKMVLGRVIREIGRYALAKVDQGRFSIQVHRLVQAVLRDSLSAEEYENTQHDVHRILVQGRPPAGDTDDPENWSSYNEIWPHLGPSGAGECTEEPTRNLLVERVRYMWKRGELDDALAYARRLETVWLKSRGQEDRQLLNLQYHIAVVLRAQGDIASARRMNEKLLERQTALFGAGAELHHAGQLPDAVRPGQPGRRCLHAEPGLRPVGGRRAGRGARGLRLGHLPRDPRRGAPVHARVREQPRHLPEGRRSRERRAGSGGTGARTAPAHARDRHPFALSCGMNVANALAGTGLLDSAEHLERSTLEGFRGVLGPRHPDTLFCAGNLAVTLRALGRRVQAEALMAETVLSLERALGGHPHIAWVRRWDRINRDLEPQPV